MRKSAPFRAIFFCVPVVALTLVSCGDAFQNASEEPRVDAGSDSPSDALETGADAAQETGADAALETGTDVALETGEDTGSVDCCCEASTCTYTFSWKNSAWSDCTKNCDGGTRTRTVSCVRDDGTTVDDVNCTEPKPAESEGCNTQPCCTTEELDHQYMCTGGTAWSQSAPFVPNNSSPEALTGCANWCTTFAEAHQKSEWCCEYYLHSDETTWVCRIWSSPSRAPSTATTVYANVGQCQSPD